MVNPNGIIDPSIDDLMTKVDSKYALVTFAAQRARQINDYYADLHDGNLLDNVGPLVDSSVDDKPLTVALHEIAEGKLELKQGAAAVDALSDAAAAEADAAQSAFDAVLDAESEAVEPVLSEPADDAADAE